MTTIIKVARQYAGRQVSWSIAIVGWQYFEHPFDPAAVQAVNDGQRLVTDTVPVAFEGPYTDVLDLSFCHDGAHFNAAGLQIHAEIWQNAIMRRINRDDFENDGYVDFVVFSDFARKWLEIDCCS
ncbi:MAG: hypothetical protein JXD22_13575 [Sedimentisphaerales bacterium]|nr:hypothetical protein [Sedimentisphaerales bacterium]